ncbi:MAG: AAA family ATPase, partial [Pseudomonadota bacterium]
LPAYYSMMTHAADPRRAPELLALRERMQSWRFYDHFRTDRDAPARQPRIGTRTPVLASDGSDFAAALQTILEIGDSRALAEAIDDAFPDAELSVAVSDSLFEVVMGQPGMLRPLRAAELSDGTLRYCLLATALLSPRAPGLLVLNEPETSLHPDLLKPLARLIMRASETTQIIVVSHADALVEALSEHHDAAMFHLSKELGETVAAGVDAPPWEWPRR